MVSNWLEALKKGFGMSAPKGDSARRKTRFAKMDRVLCFIGLPDMPWVPGTIQSLNEEDPSDPRKTLPYVVKVDPPINRLISVPKDVNSLAG